MDSNILQISGRKGQISVEFMVALVMGMLVVLGLLIIFGNKLHDLNLEKKQNDAQAILLILQEEADFAKGAEDGYTRTFSLPITLDGNSYELNLTEGTLAISYDGMDFTKGFSYAVQGSLCLETLDENTRVIQVKKESTGVTISACPDCEPNYYACAQYSEEGRCSELDTDLGSGAQEQCQDYYCLCD